MSGRSAFVRAKNTQQADRRAYMEQAGYEDGDYYPYDYSNTPTSTSRPTYSTDPMYVSTARPPRRRHSVSSSGTTYGYPPPLRKPRPIIVASAIEKSDFRTHLDGMTSSLRGKLGKLLNRGDSDSPATNKRSPGSATIHSDSDSRSTGWTPSINAVPSLSPSTSPTDVPSTFPSLTTPNPNASRHRQQHESVLHKIRRFEGGGKLPHLDWKSLSNNPELWDEEGDTFVYMYMLGSRTKPPPSFRTNSRVIKESGSQLFTDKIFETVEPEGWPRFCPQASTNASSSMDDAIVFHESPHRRLSMSKLRSEARGNNALHPLDASKRFTERATRGIQHEIYVAWPGAETGIHSTIWHITTRNFFAVMYDASALVGTTLHEAISKLFERVTMYPDYLDRNISSVAWITDYITRHKFDDVRNNPSYAASLLAFSEEPGVRWREGYVEAFVHCTGMLNMGIQTIPEWRHVTPHTKMFLQNASMEIEERIHRAQHWLLAFDFTEMWPTSSSAPPSMQRGCFERLSRWLCRYYEQAFVHWPPNNEPTWLTRDIVLRLKKDFYGLYDYFVDRDIMFDGSEYRPGQKWAITSKSGQSFRADSKDLPFTDILIGFDDRNRFPHIPHPYPIVPPSAPVQIPKQKSTFTLKKPPSATALFALSRRKALTYSEASNVYTLRDQYMHTDLVANFIRFEQSDMLECVDPYEARRGRWLLIYGILQVLATVSVDSPNLRYRDGAQYHLSPQMKGVVPWAEHGAPPEEEAGHTRSHCWIVPSTWTHQAPKARVGAHKPIIWGQYGDGRARGEEIAKKMPQLQYRKREVSLGHERAAEWVAMNRHEAPGSAEIISDGETTAETDMGNSNGLFGSSVENMTTTNSGTGMTASGASSGEYSIEERAAAARKRRAQLHGFTDFQPPPEW